MRMTLLPNSRIQGHSKAIEMLLSTLETMIDQKVSQTLDMSLETEVIGISLALLYIIISPTLYASTKSHT
jgi:hypothetical protein